MLVGVLLVAKRLGRLEGSCSHLHALTPLEASGAHALRHLALWHHLML